jgi:capsule polysaccharide export protein KpsE/RkpR
VVPYGSADLSRMPVWVLPLIGLFILCIFVFALVSSVFYIKDTTLQTTMMTGALGMALTTVGYYFGSSSGSKAKDDTIAVKMNS